MGFPTLSQVILSVIILVVGVSITYLLSRALKLRPKSIAIAEPRKEATLASLVAVALFVLVFVWRTLTHMFQLFDERSPFVVGAVDVLWMALLDGVGFVVLIVAMKSSGQSFGIIGINGKGKGRNLALGFGLSVIYLAVTGLLAPFSGGGFAGFSPSLAYGLVLFAVVGFSEEVLWRGYIQTRLIAYGGRLKGLVVTSLLFAVLWHFPGYYYLGSGVVLEALAQALMLFPVGLVFGYVMLKSQNILPSSVFHLFWDWGAAILWQIAS